MCPALGILTGGGQFLDLVLLESAITIYPIAWTDKLVHDSLSKTLVARAYGSFVGVDPFLSAEL